MKYASTWTDNFTQRINFVSFPKGISDKQLRPERCKKSGMIEFDICPYVRQEIRRPCWI